MIFTYYLALLQKMSVSALNLRPPKLLCANPTHELHRIFEALQGKPNHPPYLTEKVFVLNWGVKCKQLAP